MLRVKVKNCSTIERRKSWNTTEEMDEEYKARHRQKIQLIQVDRVP